MEWSSLGLLLVLFGFLYLVRVSQRRSFSATVKMSVQSREKDDNSGLPKDLASFSKTLQFIVTPVPGMEIAPAGIEGAIIKRVFLDDGFVEVWCVHTIAPFGDDFESVCGALAKDGWHKETY